MSRAKEITLANGGKWMTDHGVMPTPGHSNRDNGTKIWDGANGRVVIHCWNAEWQDVRDALGLGTDECDQETKEQRRQRLEQMRKEQEEREARQLAQALDLWKRTTRMQPDTPAWRYLSRRGIPADLLHLVALTGYVRDLDEGDDMPRMAAQAKNSGGQSRCVQVTKLNPGGLGRSKTAYKLTYGPARGGVAVRLTPPKGDTLAIAEGVETALSYSAMSGLPCWATLGTDSLEKFQPPAGVKTIIIAADQDEAGQKAAAKLCDALRIWHRVIIHTPEQGDWNDVLRQQERAA